MSFSKRFSEHFARKIGRNNLFDGIIALTKEHFSGYVMLIKT